jgi:hypothetical protein
MSGNEKGAWSTLRILLAEKNLTVVDLHEMVRKQGFDVNKKSLYRLATSRPILGQKRLRESRHHDAVAARRWGAERES